MSVLREIFHKSRDLPMKSLAPTASARRLGVTESSQRLAEILSSLFARVTEQTNWGRRCLRDEDRHSGRQKKSPARWRSSL